MRIKRWWRDLYAQHRTLWTVLFMAWMLAAGLLIAIVPKVHAAEPTSAAVSSICHPNPDLTCYVPPKQGARMFRAGHYHRSHGFAAGRVFRHPRAAKRAFIHKFEHLYAHASAARKSAMRTRYAVAPGRTSSSGGSCIGWSIVQCVAHRMYTSVTTNVSCGSTNPYPNTQRSTCTTWSDMRGGFTKDRVQRGGQVGFCAGNALIAVRSAASSPEGPTPLFFAAWGTATCSWLAWDIFSG